MKFKLDMSDVKPGFISVGKHKAKVISVSKEEGAAGPYLKWKFQVIAGESKGKEITANTSLTLTALWKLKELMEAVGYDVPKGQFTFDSANIIGKTLEIECVLGKPNKEGKQYVEVGKFHKISGAVAASTGSVSDDDDDEVADDDDDTDDIPF